MLDPLDTARPPVVSQLKLPGYASGASNACPHRLGLSRPMAGAWIQQVAKHIDGPYAASSGDMTSCGPPGRAQGCAPSPRRLAQRCTDDNAPYFELTFHRLDDIRVRLHIKRHVAER
jgi:hypothetical protein